jgi:hypothetical protein
MKAKEFIPVSKPRNFVAKNAQSSGAGRHQDSSKKKDQEQGKVKHKKDLVPMEDVAEATSAAVRMQRAADKQRAKSDASLARTPSSIPKKPEPKNQSTEEGWSDAYVARRTGQPRTPYSVYIKGKKWKDFENDDHARAVMDKLKAKFKADGRNPETITIAPTDMVEASNVNPQFINAQVTKILASEARRMTNAPMAELLAPIMKEYNLTLQQINSIVPGGLKKAAAEYGIMMKEGETARDKWNRASAEREKKHDAAEKEMRARHARGEEDMKGSIDRLEKHMNNK